MATDNLTYLENKLVECNAAASRTRQLRDGWIAEKQRLSVLVSQKQQQLAGTPSYKKKERNALSAAIMALSQKVQEAVNKTNLYQNQINSKTAECSKLQKQIDDYVAARTEAAQMGMNQEEQNEYADRETAAYIAEWELQERREKEEESGKKATTIAIIAGVSLLVIGLIIWAVIRKKNKTKAAA